MGTHDDQPNDPFAGQPHYAERLRASFDPLPGGRPDESARVQYEQEAASLLASLLAIEEYAGVRNATSGGDEEHEAGPEFLRLERKLDLVLELLSTRLLEGGASPERSVQMSATGVRWATGDASSVPAPGSWGVANVYVHRLLPRALRLPAEVLADEPGWLRLRFVEVGEGCREMLVRHVFQQHRRHLAGARRGVRS
jgi:hypothetical protein